MPKSQSKQEHTNFRSNTEKNSNNTTKAFDRRFPRYTCWFLFLFLFPICLFLLSEGVSREESSHRRRRRRLFVGLHPWETSFRASNCISDSHPRNIIWPTLPRTNRSCWSVCPVLLPPPGTQYWFVIFIFRPRETSTKICFLWYMDLRRTLTYSLIHLLYLDLRQHFTLLRANRNCIVLSWWIATGKKIHKADPELPRATKGASKGRDQKSHCLLCRKYRVMSAFVCVCK